MSRASESRRLAIRLVDALKREGHNCTIEIDKAGMPLISVIEHVDLSVERITFELELGSPSGLLGATHNE